MSNSGTLLQSILNDLRGTSVLERRGGFDCFVDRSGSSASILFAYSEVKGPASIGKALEFVRDHQRFAVRHLPGLRDEQSQLVLARKLVREGLLRVVDSDEQDASLAPVPVPATVKKPGELVIVGSGIKGLAHMTVEAQGWIKKADCVLFCVSDPLSELWIRRANPRHFDLRELYSRHQERRDVYNDMVEHMLAPLYEGKIVCAVYYGHPGLFVDASHKAIATARAGGYSARMLPGVSASDCMYADLGFDPARSGCQYMDATSLLMHHRSLNPECGVVLWQIGAVGNSTTVDDAGKLPLLLEYLEQFYDLDCEVLHYQGSMLPACKPVVERIPLRQLGQGARVTTLSTLYIPPQKPLVADLEMVRKLYPEMFDQVTPGEIAVPPSNAEVGAPQHVPTPIDNAVVDFLLRIAAEPEYLLAFERDPEAVVRETSLSAEQRQALTTRMPLRITQIIYEGSTEQTAVSPQQVESKLENERSAVRRDAVADMLP